MSSNGRVVQEGQSRCAPWCGGASRLLVFSGSCRTRGRPSKLGAVSPKSCASRCSCRCQSRCRYTSCCQDLYLSQARVTMACAECSCCARTH
eukprot:2487462-Pyramimonas_sp.AAC.1